jgi:hypothetical protein
MQRARPIVPKKLDGTPMRTPTLFRIPHQLSPPIWQGNVAPASLIGASEAIAAAVARLGKLPGAPLSPVGPVRGGYMQAYQGCDIYYSVATGAHEVHGDIRAKYNALQGPAGILGLPTTDETGTPDKTGLYNHFQGGSIYWTKDTGPMMVRGAIRDLWASQGWETGPLGYPVQDEYRMVTYAPGKDPVTAWSMFQNGAIFYTDGQPATVAAVVELTPEQLRTAIRRQFDTNFHKSPENVALQPQIETLDVSSWGYGFWKSSPRKVTFQLHGFHDNGLAPDQDFVIQVQLTFDTVWQDSFTEPTTKFLVAGLDYLHVHSSGLYNQAVTDGVFNGIWNTFFPPAGPDPSTPSCVPNGWIQVGDPIPTGADLNGTGGVIDVIGILITQEGGLQILLNPVPPTPAALRKLFAQRQLDNFVDGN